MASIKNVGSFKRDFSNDIKKIVWFGQSLSLIFLFKHLGTCSWKQDSPFLLGKLISQAT
jgi:hypothetical protein